MFEVIVNVKAMLNPLAGGYTWGWFVCVAIVES